MEKNVPTKSAPNVSTIVARIYAIRIERTLEPTEVPKAFATSFPPMPKPKRKASMNPTISAHKKVCYKKWIKLNTRKR